MVGALVSSMVSISTPLVIPMGGGAEMIVQDIFDGIMPGILKIGLLFLIMNLVRKKVKPILIIFGILAVAVVGAYFGVF